MRILYVSAVAIPWPSASGGRLRSAKIIEGLSRKHEVILALGNGKTLNDELLNSGITISQELHFLEEDFPCLAKRLVARTWAKHRPALSPANHNRFRRSFLKLLSETSPDLVWFSGINSPWVTGEVGIVPAILDMDNLESRIYERAARSMPLITQAVMRLDRVAVYLAERKLANGCGRVLLANPEDVPSLHVASEVAAMPNGWDFSTRPALTPRRRKRLVFVGWLKYRPNADGLLWFCDAVWPSILKNVPDAELDIVGQYGPDLGRLKEVPGVTLHGFVQDLSPVFENAAMEIVPLRIGGGTRIKILEAWAKGVPVVSTSIGCEGLGAKDGETVLIGDTGDSFAGNCIELLKSPQRGVELAGCAYDHGRNNFDWEVLYPLLHKIVEDAAAKKPA